MRCPHCGEQLPRITQRTPWHARRRAQAIIGRHSGEPTRRAVWKTPLQRRWETLS